MTMPENTSVNWQWVATGLLTLAVLFGGWVYSGEKDRTSALEKHVESQETRLREVERGVSVTEAVTDSRFIEIIRRLDDLKADFKSVRR